MDPCLHAWYTSCVSGCDLARKERRESRFRVWGWPWSWGQALGLSRADRHPGIRPEVGLHREPMHQLDRSALAADLRRLQASLPFAPGLIEGCRAIERW